MEQHKAAFIRPGREAHAEAWGAVTIWKPEHGSIAEFIASLCGGEMVAVWSCEDLAGTPAKRNGGTRRQCFVKAAKELTAAGVELHELSTGRTSQDPADLVAMMLEAVDRISGVSGTKARGRKPKPPFTDAEKKLIATAWFNGLLTDNDQRVLAVQKFVPRFMKHDFYPMKDELRAIASGQAEMEASQDG